MSKQAACGVCEVTTNKNPRQSVALSVCLWGRGGGRQQKAAHVASSARPSLMTLSPRGQSGPPHSASRSPVEMHSQPGGPLSADIARACLYRKRVRQGLCVPRPSVHDRHIVGA